MLEILQTLYRYHSQSTARLLDALAPLSAADLEAPGCSGHGSIRDTLAHLIATQWGWFSWFDGSMPPAESYALAGSRTKEIDSLEKARTRWAEVDRQTQRCVAALTEDALRSEWSWSTPSGLHVALPLWQLMTHVANHGTHTRAQIIAAIRRSGRAPGNYEFLMFAIGEHAAPR